MTQMEIREIPCEQTWGIRHVVMWPNQPLSYVKLPNDKVGTHFGLFVEDQMVSVISVFITGDQAQFRKFATLNQEQGKGYGTKLLTHVFEELINAGVNRIWCNARVEKATYYERFEMRQTEEQFAKGGINYVIMEKVQETR